MATTGNATLNFGSTPGTNHVSVAVTGQAAIASGAYMEAYFQGDDSTATHNSYEHKMLPMAVNLTCSDVVAGTGFTINAMTQLRLTGTVKCRWVWSA